MNSSTLSKKEYYILLRRYLCIHCIFYIPYIAMVLNVLLKLILWNIACRLDALKMKKNITTEMPFVKITFPWCGFSIISLSTNTIIKTNTYRCFHNHCMTTSPLLHHIYFFLDHLYKIHRSVWALPSPQQ